MNASRTETTAAGASPATGAARFDPARARAFVFGRPTWDPATGEVALPYAIELDDAEPIVFTERHRYPAPVDATNHAAVRAAVRLLHLVAGVSYYKAACPPEIGFEDPEAAPTPGEGAFLQRLYVHGLGEYGAVNAINVRARVAFASDDALAPEPASVPWTGPVRGRRWLVPIGGGKDSFLTASILSGSGEHATPFVLGANPVVRAAAAHAAEIAGTAPVLADRVVDPALIDLNRRGALNGHVPVTAIVSLSAIVAALITGHDAVGMSNERSANLGEVAGADGLDVNHQHSKSLAFERDLRARIASLPVGYVSLLRPLSELSICRAFAERPEHHAVFTSCNANFRITRTGERQRWCNDCPKCRFVCLALAPWLTRKAGAEIFGAPTLLDPAQLDGFRALLGADGTDKPFECVGQIDECRAAAELLCDHPGWHDAPVVRWYAERLRPVLPDPGDAIARVLAFSDDHELPPALAGIVRGGTEPNGAAGAPR